MTYEQLMQCPTNMPCLCHDGHLGLLIRWCEMEAGIQVPGEQEIRWVPVDRLEILGNTLREEKRGIDATLPHLIVGFPFLTHALRMGWHITYLPRRQVYEWRRPDGLSGEAYQSVDLLPIPAAVLRDLLQDARSPHDPSSI